MLSVRTRAWSRRLRVVQGDRRFWIVISRESPRTRPPDVTQDTIHRSLSRHLSTARPGSDRFGRAFVGVCPSMPPAPASVAVRCKREWTVHTKGDPKRSPLDYSCPAVAAASVAADARPQCLPRQEISASLPSAFKVIRNMAKNPRLASAARHRLRGGIGARLHHVLESNRYYQGALSSGDGKTPLVCASHLCRHVSS